MDGPLHFPVATPPAPGEVIPIAPGVLWLRMRLPFALNHINLWLIEDGPAWTAVDTGFTLPETQRGVAAHFRRRICGGRPIRRVIVTHFHPDHIGMAGWLTEHWQAPLWITDKEWLHARMNATSGEDAAQQRRDFARRAGLDDEASGDLRRAPGQLPPRRAVGAAGLPPHRRGQRHRDRRTRTGAS